MVTQTGSTLSPKYDRYRRNSNGKTTARWKKVSTGHCIRTDNRNQKYYISETITVYIEILIWCLRQ